MNMPTKHEATGKGICHPSSYVFWLGLLECLNETWRHSKYHQQEGYQWCDLSIQKFEDVRSEQLAEYSLLEATKWDSTCGSTANWEKFPTSPPVKEAFGAGISNPSFKSTKERTLSRSI